MFCKNCGREIADNSMFCNFCGSEQKLNSSISNSNLPLEDEKPNKTPWIILSLCLFSFVILLIVGIASGVSSQDTGNSTFNSSFAQNATRNAIKSDLVITFKKIDNYFEHDNYYMIIQAKEKITNLKLSIDYKTSSGTIVKTKVINVGKVVPGNEYRFELDQNSIDWDYLDKTTSFSYSIISGTVEE